MKVCPACGTEYGDDAAFCSRDRSPLRPATAGTAHGLVGQLIADRYQVERRLGEGGMGEVYLARHVLMGRPCALKVMSQALSRDPDAVSRFNREATNASRIAHPNVCAIYDFGLTQDGLVYLAMEYVEGEALSAVLGEGPLPVARAAGLVAQCALGLQAAHDLGIVHRDLKPDNIMVTPKPRETAKLVDFGIAKAVEGEPGQRVTKTGFVVGTPEYMAPEQLAGDPLDGRSDQYALALVFYRAITGLLPFQGSSVQETLVKRLTDPPRPLAAARPDVRFPAGLQGVMDRALARDPVGRYPTVTAFSDAIGEIVRGDAVATHKLAQQPSADGITIPPTRQTARTRRAGIPFLLTVGGVLALGGGAWALLQFKDGVAPSPAPASTPLPPLPPPPPPADTQAGRSESSVGAPVRPSAPPTGQPSSSAVIDVTDTLVPEPEDFDNRNRGDSAVLRTERIMNNERLHPRIRARAAYALGSAALARDDRAAALEYYRRANRLFPTHATTQMIRQLDSVPQ